MKNEFEKSGDRDFGNKTGLKITISRTRKSLMKKFSILCYTNFVQEPTFFWR